MSINRETERGADLSPHRVTTSITEARAFSTGIFMLQHLDGNNDGTAVVDIGAYEYQP